MISVAACGGSQHASYTTCPHVVHDVGTKGIVSCEPSLRDASFEPLASFRKLKRVSSASD